MARRSSSVSTCAPANIKQCAIEGKVALQESCFVPRANSKSEGDGYVMTIASNFETMSSDLILTDAQHLEEASSPP